MNRRWLILLSGTSCSGKSTIARALAKRLSTPNRPFLNIEADQHLPHLPDDWSNPMFGESLSRALHRSVAASGDQGFDLIVDGVLPYGDSQGIADALEIFSRFRFCYVGVHCDPDILEAREKQRPDRDQGWARRQLSDLHKGQRYDIEIDTTGLSPDHNAELVARYLFDQDACLPG